MDTKPDITVVPQSSPTITIDIPSDNIQNPQDIPIVKQVCCDNLLPHLHATESKTATVAREDEPASPVKNTEQANGSVAVEGEIVQEKPKHPGGRPSSYSDEKLQIAERYYMTCLRGEVVKDKNGEEKRIQKLPLMEELARLCGVHGETLTNWCDQNEEFFETVKKIKELQKEKIIMKGFSAKNPAFSIFMLKANHGMIETEKRVLTGEKQSDPIQLNTVSYRDAANQLPTPVQQAVIDEGSQ